MGRKKAIDTSELASDEFLGMDYETFRATIVKDYGERAIMSADLLQDPDPNLSGSLSLDIDLRIPFPAGRIIEVLGEEHSGKTTLILEILLSSTQYMPQDTRKNWSRYTKHLISHLIQ